jgi:hypothetical protein
LGENGTSGEDGSKVKLSADTGSLGVSFLLEDIYRRLRKFWQDGLAEYRTSRLNVSGICAGHKGRIRCGIRKTLSRHGQRLYIQASKKEQNKDSIMVFKCFLFDVNASTRESGQKRRRKRKIK